MSGLELVNCERVFVVPFSDRDGYDVKLLCRLKSCGRLYSFDAEMQRFLLDEWLEGFLAGRGVSVVGSRSVFVCGEKE